MPATRSAIIKVIIILCFLSLAIITLHLNYGTTVCHEGTFLCHRSDICIANKYKCNNFLDCPFGEDEDPVICDDLHGGLRFYDKALKFNWTTVRKNKTKEVSPCVLTRYPAKCECNATTLRCNFVGLKKVPRNISNNVKKISMIGNNIVLYNDSFDGYYALKMIHLPHNKLSRIPPFTFKHQHQLNKLHLLNNNLKILEKDVFYGLDKVIILFLDNNKLEFLNLNSWQHMGELTWLDLSHNLLTFNNESFPRLINLTQLHLQWNRIGIINEFLFENLPNLRTLTLQHNMITVIHKKAFRNTKHLVELKMNDNRITTVTQEILYPLKLLNKLALGNNPIKQINGAIFMEMKSLFSLNLVGINKDNIEMSLFANLTDLKFLYLKEFHYCVMYAQHVQVCLPNTDGLSSSYNLLSLPIFRWTLWTVSFFTFVMNALVLYGRMFVTLKADNQGLNFVIRNLAVADLLMVVYLTVIGYHDAIYDKQYYRHAPEWESSNVCTLIGIIAVISSEVSMLILVFLSLDRFLLIAVPLSGHQVLKLKTAVYSMVSIWSVGIGISLTPLLLWKHSSRFYGSNGLCYPLYIEDPFLVGWQYSAFIFFGLHASSLFLLSVLYSLMFISVRRTTRQAERVSAGDFDIAVRFFFIVLANSLCWLPIIVLKAVALKKFHISSKMYGWLIIFAVPINALVNPLMYTFTTPKYRNAITSLNVFKLQHRDSERDAEVVFPIFMLGERARKYRMKIKEKENEKTNTRESSLEMTNKE